MPPLKKQNQEKTFYKIMREVCLKIPHGRVATYGQIALLCGKPRNARQVGYALRNNLAGDDIPAHRIVNSKGILSGADAFLVYGLQKELLAAEGVEVSCNGADWQVDLKKYGWIVENQ